MVKKIIRKPKKQEEQKVYRMRIRVNGIEGLDDKFVESFPDMDIALKEVEARYIAKGFDKDIFNVRVIQVEY